MQSLVVSVLGDEFVVRAALDNSAFVEHADFVGIANGREAMGHGHGLLNRENDV